MRAVALDLSELFFRSDAFVTSGKLVTHWAYFGSIFGSVAFSYITSTPALIPSFVWEVCKLAKSWFDCTP